MDINSRLEHLRSKPEHVRNRIAFWSSFGITALIFVFWLASSSIMGSKTEGALANATSRIATPSESLIAGVGGFFSDIGDLIFKPKKIEYAEVEVKPGNK